MATEEPGGVVVGEAREALPAGEDPHQALVGRLTDQDIGIWNAVEVGAGILGFLPQPTHFFSNLILEDPDATLRQAIDRGLSLTAQRGGHEVDREGVAAALDRFHLPPAAYAGAHRRQDALGTKTRRRLN